MHRMNNKVILIIGIVLFAVALGVGLFGYIPTYAAGPTPTPAPAPAEATPPPFTAQIGVVAMYPAMGEINKDTGRPTGILVPRGDDPKKTYAVFSPGTANVPPGVPVYVKASASGVAQGAAIKDYAWTIKGPDGSAVAIAKVEKEVPGITMDMATFTPDKEGEYAVGLVVTDDKGTKSAAGEQKIVVAKYVGNEVCAGCHKDRYEGWSKTLHGTAFKRFVNENAEGEYFSAGYGCARCHTVGYYPIKESTGGWWELFGGPDKWKTFGQMIATNAFNEEKGKDTFSSLDPKVQAVSNIGCEACHGPAGAHVAKPSKESAPGVNFGSCAQCHNASGHHTRGGAYANSAHSEAADLGAPNGRAECAKCHSSQGSVDTINGVKPEEVDKKIGEIGCAVCHDPHAPANSFQLRQVDTVKVGAVEIKDAGLSANCMFCHNSNSDPKSITTDKPGYPHYSSAAEQIAGIGGFDFGFKIKNAYHVNIGKGVINDEHTNQPGNMGLTQVNDGKNPGACVLCHMYRTPGGVWDTKDSMAVPGHQKIGGHTFSMVAEQDKKVVEHVEPCQQCHPGATTFNFNVDEDLDGNGKMEGAQTEIKSLLDMVKKEIVNKAKAEGFELKTQDGYPYFVFPQDAKPSVEIKGAIYNFRYVNGVMWSGEGKGSAIHNTYRSAGLLQASYEKLTGKPLEKASLMYSK